MLEHAGYLPGISEDEIEWKILNFGPDEASLEVLVPVLTNRQMTDLSKRVHLACREHLKNRPVMEIVDIIDRTVSRLLDRQDVFRIKAEKFLPVVTGYDSEMVRLGLTRFLKTFRKPELTKFLAEDFTNAQILDEFQPLIKGGFGRAFGPDLLAHVWAGNVPGLPLWSLVSGLLVKAGNIGKVSSAEPLFAGWFARALAEVAPEIADCLAVVWWEGGDVDREQVLFSQADVVLAYGGSESLKQIRDRLPITSRFLGYGHKISFGLISRAALDTRKAQPTAHMAARDVAEYDQQGCYSPHLLFVERGGRISPREFADYLAHELACLEKRYPRRTLSISEAAKVAKWHQTEELKAISSSHGEILGDTAGLWSIAYYDQGTDLAPSGLNRTIKVVALDNLHEVTSYIAPYNSILQTAGIAASPEELHLLAASLGEAGVTRISALGNMAAPEAGWHHDGRFNLLDLVTITEIEQSASNAADEFTSYTD